jgi:ATP-binding cassette, subfamily B, bacterial
MSVSDSARTQTHHSSTSWYKVTGSTTATFTLAVSQILFDGLGVAKAATFSERFATALPSEVVKRLFNSIWVNLPRTFRLVWDGARSQVLLTVLLEFIATGATVAQLAVARRLLRQLREAITKGQVTNGLVATIVFVGALAALIAAITAIQQFYRPLAIEMVTRHTYACVLRRLRTSRLEEFDEPTFHDRVERLSKDGVERPAELVWAFAGLITGIFGLVAIGGFISSILPEIVPMVVLGTIPLLVAGRIDALAFYAFIQRVSPIRRRAQYLRDLLTDRRAAAELAAYGLRPGLEARHDVLQNERIAQMSVMAKKRSIRSLFSALATMVVTVLALLLIARRTVAGNFGIDSALAVVLAVQQLSQRMTLLRIALTTVHSNQLFLNDLHSFLEPVVEPVSARSTRPLSPDELSELSTQRGASIEITDVSFKYPNQVNAAVNNVSLHINPGQVVALVGENGSGKTTLAKIIAGLYAPQQGSVCVDDVDLATRLGVDRTRHAVTVFQDFARYALSAYDNVSLGDVTRADDVQRVNTAIDLSGLRRVVDGLPHGVDTVLAAQFDGGVDLSSGQWQRFALARAFFREAPVLLLDEPSAALDARAEFELFERVRDLGRGRTVILISHRLASVRGVDKIIVMQRGDIIETGNHAQLLAAGGLYAELLSLQERTTLGSLD